MSLLYRAFGVPRTLDEFLDAASKQKHNVTITVGSNPNPTSFTYTYFIELKSGNTRFVMDDFSVGKLDPSVNQKVKNLESDLLKQAKNIQHLLQHINLESTLLSVSGDVINPEYCHKQQDYNRYGATA
jgi:hypothetical protein